ncbi:MAG: zinc ribbon domain-containing protein [Acidimicrobiia bacterium]|nr:zinc ribbon domain-containing protein [Acidimicrobiia bacterium]
MAPRATVFCSSCGVENPAAARFCASCGAAMGSVAAPGSAATAATTVRQGLVATRVMRLGHAVKMLTAIALLVAWFLGGMGVSALRWGTRAEGIVETRAFAGAGYVLVMLLVYVLSAGSVRRLAPRRKDVGLPTFRRYRRTLRERDGIRLLMSPRGLRPMIAVAAVLWLVLAWLAWTNTGTLEDEGFTLELGIYLSALAPLVGFIATLCVWPVGAESVGMDPQGNIVR